MILIKTLQKILKKRFGTSNYELERSLPKGKNVFFCSLRAKTGSYLTDNNDEDKKAKGRKKCVIHRKLKF